MSTGFEVQVLYLRGDVAGHGGKTGKKRGKNLRQKSRSFYLVEHHAHKNNDESIVIVLHKNRLLILYLAQNYQLSVCR